jgi:rRNA processing protein Gar1
MEGRYYVIIALPARLIIGRFYFLSVLISKENISQFYFDNPTQTQIFMATPVGDGGGDLLDHLLALTSQFNVDLPEAITAASVNPPPPNENIVSDPATVNNTLTDTLSPTSTLKPVFDTAQAQLSNTTAHPEPNTGDLDLSHTPDLPLLDQPTTALTCNTENLAPVQTIDNISDTAPAVQNPNNDEHPEWEEDSSPISSDDSSDESSEDDAEEGDEAYKLLTLEEQANLLMNGDGGSDDEDGNKGKGLSGQLRTKNEIPEEVIPKPDVIITPEMAITELGAVMSIVENTVVINSAVSGDVRRLDIGSLLCLADRNVIGVISETFGPVPMPFYSVRFTNMTEITEAGLSLGMKVFYSEEHSKYVFPGDLRKIKGTDASNLHDEEPGEGEMEFSDDEAEKAHKDMLKAKKRGGKVQPNGGRGGSHRQLQQPLKEEFGLSYDDAEDDEPYRPLTRPASLVNSTPWNEAPQERWGSTFQDRPTHNPRMGDSRGRGRGDRSRGGRGRGSGSDRGRGRGGYQDRRGSSSGYSQPPQSRGGNYSHPPYLAPQKFVPSPPNFSNLSLGSVIPFFLKAPPPSFQFQHCSRIRT